MERSNEAIRSLFRARGVAVVGASANREKTGNVILRNIIGGGYEGRIYPVNPTAREILGLPCHGSLTEIPGEVDLAVIVVPAAAVPAVMHEAAVKGVGGAIIISGGFREIGNDELEAEVVSIAAQAGIALIGPNCQGLNYLPNKLCASWPLISARGSMGIISQSGTIGAAVAGWAEDDGIGITASVALGNNGGVSETALLDYFASDDEIRVIAINVEGVRDGREFMESVRSAIKKKPVVVLKPGRTQSGMKAAQSHTKSIAGSDAVFDAVCRQTGLIRAEGLEEFYDYAKILGMLEKPAGKRLLILTSSGGSGILAADVAEDLGIELSPLPGAAREALGEALPPQCVISNPLDLTGDATASRYRDALEAIAGRDCADCCLLIFGDPIEGASDMAGEIKTRMGMPVVAAFLGGGEVEKEEAPKLNKAGVPTFPTPERAVCALGALMRKA